MQPKPGYKTTEFWVTAVVNIIAAVLALLAVRGLVSETEADLWLTIGKTVVAAVAPAVIAFTTGRYINARAQVKARQ
ncbi:MAG: hypothetical protein PVH18_11635 [Chloroflexota bacterium]|jgi:membrane protein DedA with SNARE-associated domain